MDAKRLLAEATALELREDVECARAAAKRETGLRTQASLLRLAALAEAVAVMQERAASECAGDCVHWYVNGDGDAVWRVDVP